MLYRAAAILIVLFWLTMTGLLLRNELRPGDSALREVPVAHVIKLLLLHEQPSDLNIFREKLRIGHLRIHPHSRRDDHTRVIDYTGNMQLLLPGLPRQRVAWNGEIEMEKTLETRRLRFGLKMHEPMEIRAEVTVLPRENLVRYELQGKHEVLESGEYSLDEAGARTLFRQLGMDPALLQSVQPRNAEKPVIKALQSSIEIRGERVHTYLVSIEHSGQTLLEFHVSQLGQILHAKTVIGYTLAPDDVGP